MGATILQTNRTTRRLSAILAADIAGYSALMGADEARTVRDLKGHQAVVLPMVGEPVGGSDFGARLCCDAQCGIPTAWGARRKGEPCPELPAHA
jgi:hypothetical protein